MLLAPPALTEIGYRLVVKVLTAPFPSTSTLNGFPVLVADDRALAMNLPRAIVVRENERLLFLDSGTGTILVVVAALCGVIGQLFHFEPSDCPLCAFQTAMRFCGHLFGFRIGMTE